MASNNLTIIVEKGTLIKCPNDECGANIAYLLEPLHRCSRATASMFSDDFHNWQFCDRMICHRCKTDWWLNGKIFTEFGWRP